MTKAKVAVILCTFIMIAIIAFFTLMRLGRNVPAVIVNLKVQHIGNAGETSTSNMPLGQSEIGPSCDDDVRVSVDFDKTCYCYLIALNPDGSHQLCFPNDATKAPAFVSELCYPDDSAFGFRLTDGAGQQAFLVIASNSALPKFDSWIQQNEELLSWNSEGQSGFWEFSNGESSILSSGKSLRSINQPVKMQGGDQFDELCRRLESQLPTATIRAVTFPVSERLTE